MLSFGFHYYEAMQQSLALQWLDRARDADLARPHRRGRRLRAACRLCAVFVGFRTFAVGYQTAFVVAGGLTLAATAVLAVGFPRFPQAVQQPRKVVLRRRYWLYYALTFMHGARRQIFTVFAGFMMVAEFKFAVHEVALLFLVNCVFNMLFAPKLGALIARLGERWALTVENVLLLLCSSATPSCRNPWIAAAPLHRRRRAR